MLPNTRNRRLARQNLPRIRLRALAACVSCKDRKLKCDDQVPSCANCNRLDVACLIEDPATKRRLPRNYLDTLEERVKYLEGLLQQHGQPEAPVEHSPSDIDHLNSAARSSTGSGRDENNNSMGLVSRAGVLDLQASGAEPQYLGSSSMFSFSRVIHACVRQTIQERPQSDIDELMTERDGSSITPCPVPSYQVGKLLSNAYFENVHLQYPFLHEPTFRHWEHKVVGQGVSVASAAELFFVNMVYAIGGLLKANTRSLPQQLYASALLHLDIVLSQKNLESIQALLCIALFSLRSAIGPSVWNLSGLALRQCIELGYHRSGKNINIRTNALRLELRKRAFWCAYQMDCASSVMLGLPLNLPIHEVDTEFPLDIDDSSITEAGIQGLQRQSSRDPITTVSHALHQFRIRCLWARIYSAFYSNARDNELSHESYKVKLQSFRKELDDWMAATPPEPRQIGVRLMVFASIEDYKLTYNETVLLLHRRHLIGKEIIQDDVFLECAQVASSMCQQCKRLYVGKPINYSWSTLHVIFLSGLTYLHCLWASAAVRQAVRIDGISSTLTTCTMLLAIMAERWEGAAPYRNLFEALSSRTMAMIAERNQEDRSVALPTPSDSGNANVEDLTQWVSQIADTGMPDAYGSLLSSIVGDFSTEEEAQEFYNSLWNF